MKPTIQYIEKELHNFYPPSEIEGFTRLIVEYVCGYSYTDFILRKNEKLDKNLIDNVVEIVRRLKTYEPIQYIFGETEFYGLKIEVNRSVLIPRQETEELVNWVTETIGNQKVSVLDIGTGSGCIALAIKKTATNALVSGVDISEKAIKTAKQNAKKNKLDVHFFYGDVLNPDKNWGNYNVIVSNPPYVKESEKLQMHPNVLNFEPETALFVNDADPLLFYREITLLAKKALNKNGWMFFEINENLGPETVDLLQKNGFSTIQIKKDVNGKNRMLRCFKNF